ncbi:hypothetical protein [Kibdelosporangium aridum]|uniref:hypothetical protein n=1 Tax=Kibdelosporangium aridum TaxID=2030 RepID=UPI0035E8684E
MTSMLYTHGSTPLFASQVDQRLHYCLHVPRELPDSPAPLVVIQHGTGRTAQKYRTAMRDFAEEHKVVVLAPLFPAGLIDPDDVHNFKFIEYRGIRFDLMLLAIIDEVAARYPVAADRFYLHGFSGGGPVHPPIPVPAPATAGRGVDRRARPDHPTRRLAAVVVGHQGFPGAVRSVHRS